MPTTTNQDIVILNIEDGKNTNKQESLFDYIKHFIVNQ